MLNKKRILIVRLSSIGDVLHTTPVVRALKAAFPTCHITWIVSKTAAKLLADNPYIDQILVWSREELELAAANRHFGQLHKLWQQLQNFYRKEKFDIALDVHGLFLTGAILYASKTPRRIGLANTRELNRFFMTEQAPAADSPHIIRRYLAILEPLGIHATDMQMTLCLAPALEAFARQFCQENKIDPRQKLLLVNPRTSWHSKNWGDENFAACLSRLDDALQIVLVGGPDDRPAADYIQSRVRRPLINAAGKTSLLELGALLQKADLLLTGDTGSLHIAAALSTPTISLWGPTRPEQYAPCAPEHVIVRSSYFCSGCHKSRCKLKSNACMQAITPALVAEKIHHCLMNRQ